MGKPVLTLVDDPQNIRSESRGDITKQVDFKEYRPQIGTPVLVDMWWRQVVPRIWTLLRGHQCANVCSWTWNSAWYSVCILWPIFSTIKSLVWSWTPQEEGCSRRNKGAAILLVPHCIVPYRFFFWCLSPYSDSLWLGRPGDRTPVGRYFPHLSRTARRTTQPPVQWVPGLSRE